MPSGYGYDWGDLGDGCYMDDTSETNSSYESNSKFQSSASPTVKVNDTRASETTKNYVATLHISDSNGNTECLSVKLTSDQIHAMKSLLNMFKDKT